MYFLSSDEQQRLDVQLQDRLPQVICGSFPLPPQSLKRLTRDIELRVGKRLELAVSGPTVKHVELENYFRNDAAGIFNFLAEELFKIQKLSEDVVKGDLPELVSDILLLCHLGTNRGPRTGRASEDRHHPERFGRFWVESGYSESVRSTLHPARSRWKLRLSEGHSASKLGKEIENYCDFVWKPGADAGAIRADQGRAGHGKEPASPRGPQGEMRTASAHSKQTQRAGSTDEAPSSHKTATTDLAVTRRKLVDDTIKEAREKGMRLTRKMIWQAAKYKDRTAFERWQGNRDGQTEAAKRNIERVLGECPWVAS